MLDLYDQPPSQRLRIVYCFAHRLVRGRWDILRAKAVQPLARRGFIEDRGELRDQSEPVFRPRGIGAKTCDRPQSLRCIDDAENPEPQRIGADGSDKMAAVS